MKADEASLARLMMLAQKGDKPAYGAALTACQAWLRRYFARRIAPHNIDDLVQETLLSVHHKLASYDSTRPFLPWLAVIARYRWVDHLRRAYRADEVALDGDYESLSDEPGIAARISLDQMFAAIPAAQVKAIELVKIEGLSVSEAAAMSGQSESLIKVNIHRGLKRLAAMIEKE
jgi:RNA polymerase sigma factor (sigma-70 family)